MKVGDYVRTKWGYICKIVNINEFREPSMKYGVEASYLKDIMFIGDEDIIKSSPNIIDLIEVGDIVNYGLIGGGMVLHKENDKITTNTLLFGILENKDIKTIITKEQMESMKYEVN